MSLFPEAKIIKFTIDLEPHAQERIRNRILRGKGGRLILNKQGEPFTVTHRSTNEAKADAALEQMLVSAKNRLGLRKMEGPLRVGIAAYLPRPKDHYGTGKNQDKVKVRAPEYHTKQKDLDNFVKHFKDCANDTLWKDDCQIFEYLPHTGKYWTNGPGYWLIGIQEV